MGREETGRSHVPGIGPVAKKNEDTREHISQKRG